MVFHFTCGIQFRLGSCRQRFYPFCVHTTAQWCKTKLKEYLHFAGASCHRPSGPCITLCRIALQQLFPPLLPATEIAAQACMHYASSRLHHSTSLPLPAAAHLLQPPAACMQLKQQEVHSPAAAGMALAYKKPHFFGACCHTVPSPTSLLPLFLSALCKKKIQRNEGTGTAHN